MKRRTDMTVKREMRVNAFTSQSGVADGGDLVLIDAEQSYVGGSGIQPLLNGRNSVCVNRFPGFYRFFANFTVYCSSTFSYQSNANILNGCILQRIR